jgi:hypothetical protein
MVRIIILAIVLAGGIAHAGPGATVRVAPTPHGGKLCGQDDRDPRCHLTHVVAIVQRISGDRSAKSLVELNIQAELSLWNCITTTSAVPVQAVTVELALDDNGAVVSSIGKGRDAAMSRCVADTVSRVQFAKPRYHAKPLWRHGSVAATVIVYFAP